MCLEEHRPEELQEGCSLLWHGVYGRCDGCDEDERSERDRALILMASGPPQPHLSEGVEDLLPEGNQLLDPLLLDEAV